MEAPRAPIKCIFNYRRRDYFAYFVFHALTLLRAVPRAGAPSSLSALVVCVRARMCVYDLSCVYMCGYMYVNNCLRYCAVLCIR